MGIGISFIQIKHDKKETFVGFVYDVKDNYYLLNSEFERLYVYEKENNREIGDILEITAKKEELSFTTLESAFDFKEYLNNRGVFSELTKISKVSVKFSFPLKLHNARNYFLSKFDKDTKALVSSILFSIGETSDLTDSIRGLHLGKFLSANGTYISLFITLFSFFLSKVFQKKWADLSSFFILLLYLVFVFPRFSAIRISLLFLLRWINKYLLKNKFHYIEVLSFSGIFFLIMNPYLAGTDGFILGYLIPLVFYFVREAVKYRHKILRKVYPLLFVYVFLIPFELSFYQSVAPLSLIFQILLTPLFILIGIISLLCFFRIPLYAFVGHLISFLKNITKILQPINFEINGPTFNPIFLLIYYVLFFAFVFYFKIRFVPMNKIVGIIGLSFSLLYFLPINNLLTNQVTFINVGQGDSCLIRDRNTTVLIDTGGLKYTDVATSSLIPYFKKHRIYDIDLLIATHADYDHIGAKDSLEKNFHIKHFVDSASSFPIKVGRIELSNYNNHTQELEDENAKSLVIGFNIGKRDYLVMGDATLEVENYIMNEYSYIPCDVLKVGHHGSKTSSSSKFLNFIHPKEAVVSVGKNNSYGLPDKSVIQSLHKLGIIVKRTDELGSITYKNYIFNS